MSSSFHLCLQSLLPQPSSSDLVLLGRLGTGRILTNNTALSVEMSCAPRLARCCGGRTASLSLPQGHMAGFFRRCISVRIGLLSSPSFSLLWLSEPFNEVCSRATVPFCFCCFAPLPPIKRYTYSLFCPSLCGIWSVRLSVFGASRVDGTLVWEVVVGAAVAPLIWRPFLSFFYPANCPLVRHCLSETNPIH